MHKLTDDVKEALVGPTRESAMRLGDIRNKNTRRRAARDVHKARSTKRAGSRIRKESK